MKSDYGRSRSQTAIFFLLMGFFGLCFLFGGSSRVDVMSQPVVRLGAVALMSAVIALRAELDWSAVRTPGLVLAAAACLALIQLVPLPPSIWTLLPGREDAATTASLLGVAQPWRPISLTPDFTLNSLLSLLPAAATITALAALSRDDRYRLLPVILIGACLSIFVGLLQITTNDLYFYSRTNIGYPVGIFANRNHQAALVALLLPCLAVWAAASSGASSQVARARKAVAAAGAIGLLPFILANGSRAGLGLSMAALVIGVVLYYTQIPHRIRLKSKKSAAVAVVGIVGALALLAGAAVIGRNDAVTRIGSASVEEDNRFRYIPIMTVMAGTYFPFGSGLGSFDAVFRRNEPTATLDRTYFNHAHNDVLEVGIETGIFGLLILSALLAWWGTRCSYYWRDLTKPSRARLYGRLGSVIVGTLCAASLVDYPLRTPLLSCIFFLALAWMQAGPTIQSSPPSGNDR